MRQSIPSSWKRCGGVPWSACFAQSALALLVVGSRGCPTGRWLAWAQHQGRGTVWVHPRCGCCQTRVRQQVPGRAAPSNQQIAIPQTCSGHFKCWGGQTLGMAGDVRYLGACALRGAAPPAYPPALNPSRQ